jgi:hypothetical protein
MTDTSITAQTLINSSIIRARDLDKTNDRLTDEQLLIYLNKAREYVHQILIRENSEIAIDTGSISMVGTQQEYELADDLPDFWAMSTNGVYFSSSPLLPMTYEEKIREGTTTADTAPVQYYVTKTHLGVVPIPTVTSATAYPTLYCRYFKYPTPLTLESEMPYKNALNSAMSAFLDSVGALSAEKQTAEFSTMYNTLEDATMQIIRRRVPL